MEVDGIDVELPSFVCGLDERGRFQSVAVSEDDSEEDQREATKQQVLQHSVLWSPFHHRIISIDSEQRLSCWEIKRGKGHSKKKKSKAKCQSVQAHEEWVSSFTLSADACLAVTGSYDYELAVWKWPVSSAGGQDDISLQCRLRGHKDYVTSVALASNQNTLFSSAEDGYIFQWDLTTGTYVYQLPEPVKAVTTMLFSANDNFLFLAGIHDQAMPAASSAQIAHCFQPMLASKSTSPPSSSFPTLAYSPSLSSSKSSQSSPERTDFSLTPETSRRKIMAYAEAMWKSSRMHSFDKYTQAPMQRILVNDSGWEVMVWDVEKRQVRHRFPSNSCIGAMAMSKDGQKLYVANEDEILVWELEYDANQDFLPIDKPNRQVRRFPGCHIVKVASDVHRIFSLSKDNLNTIVIINEEHADVLFTLPLFTHHTLPYPGNYCFDISPSGDEIVFIDQEEVVAAKILFPSPSDGTTSMDDFEEYKKGDVVIRRRKESSGRNSRSPWWHRFICK